MKFRYAYRDGNGARHEAEIEADSRDAAFSALRSQGIRPIKVVAADGSKANGAPPPRPISWGAPLVIAAVAIVAGVVALLSFRDKQAQETPQPIPTIPAHHDEKRTSSVLPLERQRIPGDRNRIENAARTAFSTHTESVLAQFAEPGRTFSISGVGDSTGEIGIASMNGMTQDDVAAAMASPVKASEDELSETIDLKRIVEGMRRELKGYLAAGGTVDEYLAELVKRQRVEISLRENVEKKVLAAIASDEENHAKAYDYWLKANAQLQSMGIYPIPLPDALRDYQFNLNLDE